MHVSGWGDYQLSEITGPSDPHPLAARRRTDADQTMGEAEDPVLSRADPANQVSGSTKTDAWCRFFVGRTDIGYLKRFAGLSAPSP